MLGQEIHRLKFAPLRTLPFAAPSAYFSVGFGRRFSGFTLTAALFGRSDPPFLLVSLVDFGMDVVQIISSPEELAARFHTTHNAHTIAESTDLFNATHTPPGHRFLPRCRIDPNRVDEADARRLKNVWGLLLSRRRGPRASNTENPACSHVFQRYPWRGGRSSAYRPAFPNEHHAVGVEPFRHQISACAANCTPRECAARPAPAPFGLENWSAITVHI